MDDPLAGTFHLQLPRVWPYSFGFIQDDEDHEAEVYNAKAIQDLDDMSVLTLGVLAETWPHEYGAKARRRGILTQPVVFELDSEDELVLSGVVDLSKQDLAPTDLLQVLKGRTPFSRLDISHNKAVDKATLAQIMKEAGVQ